jgi:uncharacterized protein (DUF433 family)
MTEVLAQTHIVQDKNICGGQPRIKDTRIKVQHIALEFEGLGWSPDKICDEHPRLSLSDVHTAIAYYYEHKKEIDESIQNNKKFIEKLKKAQ